MAANKNVDIFVYSHKEFTPIVTNPVYKILTNCKEPINTKLEVYRDYTEDNIADKNLMYNEYTGFYWLWKNYDLKDYIGMNHYRRYYDFIDDVPDINALFRKHTIILNKPVPLDVQGTVMNNREWYDFWHNVEDFDLLEQLFHEKYPEFVDGFDKMKKENYCYNSSMFTMKRDDFLEYCDFIFSILQDYCDMTGKYTSEDWVKHVENNKDKYIKPHLQYYNVTMQSRIIGYIAERAMNAYVKNGNHCLEEKAKIYKWIFLK